VSTAFGVSGHIVVWLALLGGFLLLDPLVFIPLYIRRECRRAAEARKRREGA
jgi:hypothetical protein